MVGHACPKLNFQFPNEAGNLELLKLVQEKLPEMGNNQLNKANQENQRNIAFQVNIWAMSSVSSNLHKMLRFRFTQYMRSLIWHLLSIDTFYSIRSFW